MVAVCIVRRVVVINRATQSEAGCMLTVKICVFQAVFSGEGGEKKKMMSPTYRDNVY